MYCLSSDKCSYCQSLWIKASDTRPKCKCDCKVTPGQWSIVGDWEHVGVHENEDYYQILRCFYENRPILAVRAPPTQTGDEVCLVGFTIFNFKTGIICVFSVYFPFLRDAMFTQSNIYCGSDSEGLLFSKGIGFGL